MAIKTRKREFDIFNLSFLDIISCGFGAVVMLVLISKNSDSPALHDQQDTDALLAQIFALQNQTEDLNDKITHQKDNHHQLDEQQRRLSEEIEKLARRLDKDKQRRQSVEADVAGLSLAQSTLQRATTSKKPTSNKRDEEVGGIPVDSEYVIFVIDTSGSMQRIWQRVSQEVINVLNIHPQVKGFQILSDLGAPLVSGYKGRWIPDTPQRRKSIINIFKNWRGISNSSPVEGIQTALKQYAKPTISTSIYVFGDDYTGGTYDSVLDTISQLNRAKISGKRLAKIHGIGFISPNTTDRFAVLMREVALQNGGTFLALPQ